MKLKTYQRLLLALLSVVLLSLGWLRTTGLVLLVALVPLLIISASYDSSRRSWWRMAGWVSLVMGLWTIVTCWWIYFAAAVGIVAATVVQILLFGGVFMVYHYASKRTRPVHAYTLLVAGWLWAEHFYLNAEISFPWLVLGNGFANDVWAVQWYEFTGALGGSLWVLLVNVLAFEWLKKRTTRSGIVAAAFAVVPLVCSVVVGATWKAPEGPEATVTLVQPNIDPYTEKYTIAPQYQVRILT
ncbi:MAG: apolipoprotein N-acyltransferase, partial [Tidjanibacter sp.]|nr:apolipoprotein N-acyltransferase [Tidjanibacter sp.]